MDDLRLTRVPAARTGMLVRKPPAEVFEALVDPAITSQFWFSKGDRRLEVGKPVRWEWEMYGVSVEVNAVEIEPNRRILIQWPGYSGPTRVEWRLVPQPGEANATDATDATDATGATFVHVAESGFTGNGDELLKYVADSTQGFSLMLAGLKAFLEHGVRLNLTADRYPKGIEFADE
jgi:uncharacterized protein YndB with AHSA1/START domain